MREEDLFPPVKAYLEALGYAVDGEVKNCDLAARREDELLVAELKTGFTLKLVYQALDRQAVTPVVLLCVPRPKRQKGRPWQDMLRLVKRLDLGLLTVALDSPVPTLEVHAWPSGSRGGQSKKRRRAVEQELGGRSGTNTGGVTRKKLLTAYRERMLALACAVEAEGTLTPVRCRELGLPEAALTRNYYGWFQKESRGVYGLSPAGAAALTEPEYAVVVAYYRKQWEERAVHAE